MKTSYLDRFKLALARFLLPQNFYEAGQRFSSRRSSVPGWLQDARMDANTMARTEIVRKARYFEKNNGIFNKCADVFEQYVVGEGLRIVPASSDPAWNDRAKAFFDEWALRPDVSSRQNWATLQSLIARAWFVDGEIFILKTRGRERPDAASYPRIQLVETHRVRSPLSRADEPRLVDGVSLDERARPIAYWVALGQDLFNEDFRQVSADLVIPVQEVSRTGMVRSLPFCYPVLNDLHDLDDLQLLEMDTAKESAAVTHIIKTKTGELDTQSLRSLRFGVGGTQGTSGGSSQDRTKYYDEIFRSKAKVLKHDDDYAQFNVVRPAEATRQYWDYLTAKVCAGMGISKMLVMPPVTMNGTLVRGELAVAASFFRARSSVLASKFIEVWQYVLDWGIKNDISLADPPADWRNVRVRYPRSPDVDVGRNSNAIISEYEAGFRTIADITGERGDDWTEVLEQRARERAKAKELEEKYGLDEGELIGATLKAIQVAQQGELMEAQAEAAGQLETVKTTEDDED